MSFFKKKKVVPTFVNPIDEWLVFGPNHPKIVVNWQETLDGGLRLQTYWKWIDGERYEFKVREDEYGTEEGKKVVVEAWEAWLKTCADAARKAAE